MKWHFLKFSTFFCCYRIVVFNFFFKPHILKQFNCVFIPMSLMCSAAAATATRKPTLIHIYVCIRTYGSHPIQPLPQRGLCRKIYSGGKAVCGEPHIFMEQILKLRARHKMKNLYDKANNIKNMLLCSKYKGLKAG